MWRWRQNDYRFIWYNIALNVLIVWWIQGTPHTPTHTHMRTHTYTHARTYLHSLSLVISSFSLWYTVETLNIISLLKLREIWDLRCTKPFIFFFFSNRSFGGMGLYEHKNTDWSRSDRSVVFQVNERRCLTIYAESVLGKWGGEKHSQMICGCSEKLCSKKYDVQCFSQEATRNRYLIKE